MTDFNIVNAVFHVLGMRKMRCPKCDGKGRLVGEGKFWMGGKRFATCTEIGLCPECNGSGQSYCCEGEGVDQAAATDVDPNGTDEAS